MTPLPLILSALAGLCLLRVLFYAKWWAATGGVGWGPRLLFPITALLAIAAGCTIVAGAACALNLL